MSEKSKIKIYISSHKPTDYVHNEIFVPIQVGCALKDMRLPGFIYDNDGGDNISEKNPRYCELTAQYWAWKNADADYVGFFHYRRYLAFSEGRSFKTDAWGNVVDTVIDEAAIQKYGLTEEEIRKTLDECDIVVPQAVDVRHLPIVAQNVRKQYLSSGYLHEKDLDIMMQVLKEKSPEFVETAEEYLAQAKSRFCNMFVMKKEIFDEYSKWLFEILDECDKRIDYTDYSGEAIRTPGHLAERLFNIYLLQLMKRGIYKIKELPTVIFFNTDPEPELKPAFQNNNIALALAADDNYVPYLATVLTSIRENASSENNYDILVMHKNISPSNQERIRRLFSGRENFSVRFVDFVRYKRRFEKLFTRGHFTVETWFRLLLPEIMKDYEKVLYLDSDLVVNADVAELYNTDVHDYLLTACHDADTAGLYNRHEDTQEYIRNALGMEEPYNYFQAGVILLNLEKFRSEHPTDEMLRVAAARKWKLLDQDVLNKLAQGQVKFVGMEWNVMFDWKFERITENISYAPKYLYDDYMEARKAPKIVHYAGPDKPWDKPSSDLAYYFWKYARLNECYEQIIQNMILNHKDPSFVKETVKKVANRALPKGSKRRDIMKKAYRKLRP